MGAFECLWQPPGRADLDANRAPIDPVVRFARAHHLPVQALAGQGVAVPMFVMGAQNAVTSAIDHPEALQRLAAIDHRTNLARIRLLARGV